MSGGGVMEVRYIGPMTCQTFVGLRDRVLDATRGADCVVLRLERAITCMIGSPPICEQTYSSAAAPGAVVLRLDQMAYWSAYALAVARQGVTRVVFLQSEIDAAQAWARHAAAGFRQHRQRQSLIAPQP